MCVYYEKRVVKYFYYEIDFKGTLLMSSEGMNATTMIIVQDIKDLNAQTDKTRAMEITRKVTNQWL